MRAWRPKRWLRVLESDAPNRGFQSTRLTIECAGLRWYIRRQDRNTRHQLKPKHRNARWWLCAASWAYDRGFRTRWELVEALRRCDAFYRLGGHPYDGLPPAGRSKLAVHP